MTENKNDILVLGIGSVLMQDEGVGIHAVNRLASENLAGVDVMDGGTGGFHLLGVLQSYRRVIIIDASLDKFPPGHIRVIHPKYAKDFPKQLSAHEIGLKDLIDAATLLGKMPQLHLVAVSVSEFQDMGMEMSPAVEDAIPQIIRVVKELVASQPSPH